VTTAEAVLAQLYASRRNPATLAELAEWCHASRRDVEAAVQELRHQGNPIVSDGEGIRWSDDPAEVAACARALRRRLVTQYRTLRSLQTTARRMAATEEPTLWGNLRSELGPTYEQVRGELLTRAG